MNCLYMAESSSISLFLLLFIVRIIDNISYTGAHNNWNRTNAYPQKKFSSILHCKRDILSFVCSSIRCLIRPIASLMALSNCKVAGVSSISIIRANIFLKMAFSVSFFLPPFLDSSSSIFSSLETFFF